MGSVRRAYIGCWVSRRRWQREQISWSASLARLQFVCSLSRNAQGTLPFPVRIASSKRLSAGVVSIGNGVVSPRIFGDLCS